VENVFIDSDKLWMLIEVDQVMSWQELCAKSNMSRTTYERALLGYRRSTVRTAQKIESMGIESLILKEPYPWNL
jgi:hypothetical protein